MGCLRYDKLVYIIHSTLSGFTALSKYYFRYDIGTPEEGEVCAGLRVVGDHASHGDESANRSSPAIPFSSRSSSDEDEEDDPDWCADDPDDPEWTGREEGSTGVTGQGSSSSGLDDTLNVNFFRYAIFVSPSILSKGKRYR